eukprot:916810-Pelagomonas_calceolata.AAC.1
MRNVSRFRLRPYLMPCLGEITEGTYLLRFKQGNAVDTFFDMCMSRQIVVIAELLQNLECEV